MIIENFVQRLGKHQTFEFDEHLSLYDQYLLIKQIMNWLIRGSVRRISFRRADGLVLIGQGVKIRYPHYLEVGRNFIVEDGVEIMALSRDGIICADNVTIGAYATIKPSNYYGRTLGAGLRIGRNSNVGSYNYIGCSGKINIGRNVMIGPHVSMFAENHNFQSIEIPIKEQGVACEPIIIEDDCWIAAGSIILAGVTVQRGSIVAAGSVLTHDVPSFSVVGGVPAEIIGWRKQNVVHNVEEK